MAHLDDSDDFYIAGLILKGYLGSRLVVGEVDGGIVARVTILVPGESGDQPHEVIAYGPEARFCLALKEDEALYAIVHRPTRSELNDGVQHTGMVVHEIGEWYPDDSDG